METQSFRSTRGVTSIEVVLGVFIAGIVITFAANSVALFITNAREVTEKTQALYLAEEGLEFVRYIRDQDWSELSSLATGNTHYLEASLIDIHTTSTPETIGDFGRSFTVENVYRNGSDDIVASTTGGSVADTSTKYVTVTVTWGAPAKQVSLTTMLTEINP